jgi:hypothetical protein
MPRPATRLLLAAAIALLLAGVAFTAAGCGSTPVAKKKLTPIPVTTPTVETTSSAAADAAAADAAAPVSTGPISTLTAASAVTGSLADAARTYLKTSSKFTINQLFRQGNVIVGDITPKSGGSRIFIAWVGPSWKVVWTAPMGQGGATLARAAVPQMSKELAAKMNWSPKAASAPASTPAGTDTSALEASFAAFVKTEMANLAGGADVGTISVSDVRVVKDNSGVYWASALADATYGDPVTFFGKYSGGKWIDMGNSSDGVESTDSKFPQEVQGSL